MITLLAAAALASSLDSDVCGNLTAMNLENATISSSEVVPEGVFRRPGGPPGANRDPQPIPAHCRVSMVLAPSQDSNIDVELWMPMENWNGKFMAVGNGGWAGAIQGYGDMQEALRRGYAAAATDTGHSAADGPFGAFTYGHPEKIVDFAYRAVHDMTVKSKRVIHEFYARPIDYSYFKGCSTGGRQAAMAAQRYPGDFDGIIAGAMANRMVHMHASRMYFHVDLYRHPEKAIPAATAAMINEAVLAKCDALGEGFLNNPEQCSFEFSSLQCAAGESGEQCLTPEQLDTVESFFGGVRNSAGEVIFAGQPLGNPIPAMLSSDRHPGNHIYDTIAGMGLQDRDWDWRSFDLDSDLPRALEGAGHVESNDPDLRAFKAHGGKLLLYAGWGDTAITPLNTLGYYGSVLEEMGNEQDDWMRLFMVPGMGHCGGGEGPNSFDSITVLETWREEGAAPAEIMGRNPVSGLSRPLCPYPSAAEYNGSGEVADSGNWSCRAPAE